MNSRKDFLRQSALLAAGLLVMPSCTMEPKSSNGADTKKIGLQLYTLRDIIDKDVSNVLKRVAEIGYQDVETYGFSSANGFWGLSPKEVAGILRQNNLTSSSGHYDLEEFIRTDKTDELKAIIEAAKTIGNEYVTVPYLSEDIRTSADDYKRIADKLNQAAELCKSSDLKFAYHNHDFEFLDLGNGETGYNIFLRDTDKSLVQFELDLYWVDRSGNNSIALFTENPGRFVMWHVKDMDKANPEINTEVGTGLVDFKNIFQQADKSGLEHIFVEQENFSKDPYQSITESFNYINRELLV